jgi:hypothetical protein
LTEFNEELSGNDRKDVPVFKLVDYKRELDYMHKSSYCGVNCEKCPVYIASTADDDGLRADVVRDWGTLYKREFKISDINCFGCKSDTLFGVCSKCDISVCNKNRGITSCADCTDFECDRIKRFYDYQRVNNTGVLE